jgi:hypothetical protein
MASRVPPMCALLCLLACFIFPTAPLHASAAGASEWRVYHLESLETGGEGPLEYDTAKHSFAIEENPYRIVFYSTADEERGVSPKRVKLKGAFRPELVFQTADAETLLLGAGDSLHGFELASGKELGKIALTQSQKIDRDRIVQGDVPAALKAALQRSENAPAWLRVVWPYHAYLIRDWQQLMRQVDTEMQATADAENQKDFALVQALLQGPWQSIQPSALLGAWKCRSIQVNSLGVFAYRDFNCLIEDAGDALRFSKRNGSQRKSGRLYLDAGQQMVFLGASTVNDEPQGSYSKGQELSPQDADAFGWLRVKSKQQALMLFNPDGTGYELYELRR